MGLVRIEQRFYNLGSGFSKIPVVIGIEPLCDDWFTTTFGKTDQKIYSIGRESRFVVHGMGEHQVVEIANRLRDGRSIKKCRDINGVLYALEQERAACWSIELPSLRLVGTIQQFAAMTVNHIDKPIPTVANRCFKPTAIDGSSKCLQRFH